MAFEKANQHIGEEHKKDKDASASAERIESAFTSPTPHKDTTIGSKFVVTGKGIKEAAVGEKSIVLLQTLSSDNLSSQETLDSITCEIVSEMTGTSVRGSVERREQNQYEISYQPTIKGRHQLHIKVEDQHIRGSPFSVIAKSSVEKLGSPILTISGLRSPFGAVINQRGEVVVVENDRHCVSVFSPSGEKLRSFGLHGSGQGQFKDPYGVAVDGEGCILVTDSYNHRIQKFTADGRFLKAVGTEGNGPLQFNCPLGIAYNASNSKVYVGDKSRVQILNSDLSFAGLFRTKGSGKDQLDCPLHLTCDSTGNVLVAESGNHHIQVFTSEGEFLRMFGRHGAGMEEMRYPVGLAIDSCDRVYVSDWENHRVSVFTSEGQFVTSFGRQGRGPGQFGSPAGLAVDSSGVVYVCDCDNECVQLF